MTGFSGVCEYHQLTDFWSGAWERDGRGRTEAWTLPVIMGPDEFNVPDLYVDLRDLAGVPFYLKCEGFNFAGSVKLKAAISMVDAAVRSGRLPPGGTIVESSSGNLGVALSLVAARRGYRFVCVTDSRCTAASVSLMRTLGATVHVVTKPHPEEGLLGARIRFVRRLCADRPGWVWLNQYANDDNWRAHHSTTGQEILSAIPDLDVLFVGAGTSGTLMGCARYLRDARPSVRVVAVDAVGSVSFGSPSGTRLIPGLGTGVRPPILDESFVDDVVHVEEIDAVRACRTLAARGFLFGGSTGSVVSGALAWLARNSSELSAPPVCVAISPDLGERYLDTIYRDEWVDMQLGAGVAGV